MRSNSFLLTATTIITWATLFGCGPGRGDANGTGHAGLPSTPDSIRMALEAIHARIVKDPGNASLYVDRAVHFGALDSVDRAVRDMERAIALDSTNVDYRLMLGDLHYRMVRVEEAMASFKKAAQLDPDNTSAILKQAEIELVLRHYQPAMDLVNTALRKDPNVAHGYYLKGWIHMEVRDTALAISSFHTAVEQDPNDYPAFLMLGKLSAAQGDPLAGEFYASAVRLRPNSVEALYGLAMVYQNTGRDSLALATYDRIKEIDPVNALPWYNSGFIQMEHLQDLRKAEVQFSKAIELAPNYGDAWYNRGVVMERVTQLDSAAANYQMAVLVAPGHPLALEALDRLEKKGVRIKIKEERKGP